MTGADTPDEAVLVLLTRMEGKIDGIDYKVNDLMARVGQHEMKISELQMQTQQLKSDAIAKDLTVIATAKALSEAKDAADATARAETAKAEHAWTPMMRLSAVLGSMATVAVAIITTYLAFRHP